VDLTSDEMNPRVAFIDHAFSMSQNPDFATGPVTPVGIHYVQPQHSDQAAILGMVTLINQLEIKMLEEIVGRIPPEFLPSDRASAIIKGLLKRRGELSSAFGV
jgi:hypothetical protein